MLRITALTLALLLPAACQADFCGRSTLGACSTDDDCVTGGCSGEVCQSIDEEPVITTCLWEDCYDDEAAGVSCGCQNGQCAWN